MSMEITNNYGANYTASVNNRKANDDALKTNAADKKENKSVKDKAADYYSYLQKNFDCVRNGKVSISGSFLKECANDPEKAKSLEADLAFYKESYESGRKNAEAHLRSLGDKLVSYDETWSYDNKGNLTMITCTQGTTETGAKDWKELKEEQEKKLKEKREQKRTEEKKKEEKAEQKKIEEKLQEAREEKLAEVKNENPIEAFSKTKPDNFYFSGIDVSV